MYCWVEEMSGLGIKGFFALGKGENSADVASWIGSEESL